MARKVCIAGTAPSWRATPWKDRSWEIWSLNDAWMLNLPRWDRWYELHPVDQMWFRDPKVKTVNAADVPKGAYIRPEGHLEWLKEQATRIPVFLQAAPPDDWPANAHRFPIEAIHQAYGADYWSSGPQYMLAQAALEGVTEIMITGIHLATEAEYREQRPGFEMFIGRLLGPKVEVEKRDGFRIYRGAITLWLPESTPIVSHPWKYAYEHKPDPTPNPYRDEFKRTVKAKTRLIEQLVAWPVNEPKDAALEQLARLIVIEEDCQQQLQRASMREQYAPIQAVLGA